MGKGDRKTKKGKRFRRSCGNKRPKNKNIVQRIPLSIAEMKKWSIERLYCESGRYSRTTSIVFKNKSDSYVKFGNSICGDIHYTLEERKNLERRAKNGFISEENGNVKFKIILQDNLTPNQIKLLLTEGFPNTDIFDLDYYPLPMVNHFQSKGTRKLPKPNFVISDNSNFKSSCIQELDFYKHRIQKKEKLLPFEKIKFAALAKFLTPDVFDDKLKEEYVKEDQKDEFDLIYLELKDYIGNIKSLESEALNKAIEKKLNIIKAQVENEFISASIEKKDIYIRYRKLFTNLVTIGYKFKPRIIMFSQPNVYWDFDRFLHIIFRHTWALRLGEKYDEKDVIKYDISEIENLVETVLNEIKEDMENHFKQHPNKRFSKFKDQRHYFKGDYYEFHINSEGLLETFYNSTR